MTVAELIAKLQEMPQGATVAMPDWESDGFEGAQNVGLSWGCTRSGVQGFWSRCNGPVQGDGLLYTRLVVILDRAGDPL
jgi:hypothetical protein